MAQRDRPQSRRAERARARREPSGRSRPLLRGLLQLAADLGVRAVHPRVAGRGDRRRADGLAAGAALPRPRAREGARDPPAHAVAPGSALLQRRRPPGLLAVDAGRPRRPRVDARVRGRLAPRPVAHAADVHGLGGEVVPRGEPRGAAGRRGRSRGVRDPRVGARAGRRRVLPHADAPRCGRSDEAAPGSLASASSATTSRMRRGRGRRRPNSPASPTSCPPARRWSTRSSPCSGKRS